MEAWIRAERRLLAIAGALFLLCVGYALFGQGVEPPVRGLPQPSFVAKTKGSTQLGYVLNGSYYQLFYDLDMRLQIKGFKRSAGSYQYRRGASEIVTIYAGRLHVRADGLTEFSSYDQGKTTLVYTVRTPTWWRPWRRVQRHWTAYQQAKAGKAVVR